MKELEREVLLSFWKVHILHHAQERPVFGQWVMRELRRHGYEVSPGTIYPLLARMERRGWLRSQTDPGGGPRARKDYFLTEAGGKALALLREQIVELYREVVLGEEETPPAHAAEGKGRKARVGLGQEGDGRGGGTRP
jgi:DNA-binding PadR family transcriptional regulator